jgi:hypothetical protein
VNSSREFYCTQGRAVRAGAPLVLLVGLGVLVAVGCAQQKLIPNTKIADVPENRAVLGAVESYRQAVERRDAARVYSLVDPTYQDNNGTPDGRDDIDYTTLAEVLRSRFKRCKRVVYRIEYQRISFKRDRAFVDVWLDATFVYAHPGSPLRYQRHTDHHRFSLIKTKQGWRFTSGL